MKIGTIVGSRPQFIKAAMISRELKNHNHEEVIIHTGQHYDYNMSEVFFKELEIPTPQHNLGISGGSHGHMTGKMLMRIEDVLIQEKPEVVLVYGDTNSTMAGALAAVKLHIPVCHVEAGVRLGTLYNPEEVNRIVTDDVSSLLLCCTESAVKSLRSEGKKENIELVGDPMYDAFKYYSAKVQCEQPESLISLADGRRMTSIPDKYNYVTCHRQENANDDKCLLEILRAVNSLNEIAIYPVHPRNKSRALRLIQKFELNNVILCEPVGYLMSVYLTLNCNKIVTDSGGLQREAFFAEKQCVTVFDRVSWPETMVGNRNQLAQADCEDILNKLKREQIISKDELPFGDGSASCKIVNAIEKYFEK